MTGLGLAFLRLTVAVLLVAHGSHQLFGAFAAPGLGPGGLRATAAHFDALGLTPGFVLAALVGTIQLMGGGLIAVGWLARWAAAAAMACFGIEIWKAQLRWGFFMNWTVEPGRGHGIEYSLLIGGALLCLVLAGAGEFSVDGLRTRSAASRASARARLRTRS